MPFEQVRKLFQRIRAVELHFEKQLVWETSKASPEAHKILKALKTPPMPRVLGPAKQ